MIDKLHAAKEFVTEYWPEIAIGTVVVAIVAAAIANPEAFESEPEEEEKTIVEIHHYYHNS